MCPVRLSYFRASTQGNADHLCCVGVLNVMLRLAKTLVASLTEDSKPGRIEHLNLASG